MVVLKHLGAAALVIAAAGAGGCKGESEEPELAPTIRVAVSTDLVAGTDVDGLRIAVDRGGAEAFAKSFGADVFAALPDSLLLSNGHYADDKGNPILTPITVRVTATLGDAIVVDRTAELVFQTDEAKLLRMPLCAECREVECDAGETCVRGACKADHVDIESLPPDGDDVDLAGECAAD